MAAAQDDSDAAGAPENGSAHLETQIPRATQDGGHVHDRQTDNGGASHDHDDDDDDDDEEDEDESEPKLKYSRLTGSLASVYRKGDSTSSVLTVGDKTVCPWHVLNFHNHY